MRRSRAMLQAPGLHFLALGALLFALDRSSVLWGSEPARELADIDAESLTDEEILFQEALAARLDRSDPAVRERLARLGEMVSAGDVEDAAALEHEARRLGLERSDLVVRRHLVHAMTLALAHPGPREWPNDAEIDAYFETHGEQFAAPARIRFQHLFFARDRGGLPATEAAEHARVALEQGSAHDPAPTGDAFLLGSEFDLAKTAVERDFGPGFAAALAGASTGEWCGPVESSYGVHVVWVEERTPTSTPALDSVRSRVVHALLAEQAAARLERRLAERRVHWRSRG